ncbi:hypothetical protein VCCP10303_3571, partial [Vibrio cholerae CP1030(3)]
MNFDFLTLFISASGSDAPPRLDLFL